MRKTRLVETEINRQFFFSIGSDKSSKNYCIQIRVWSSEPGDYAGSSWALRAKSEQELIQLILGVFIFSLIKTSSFLELETLKIESDEMTDLTSNNEIIDPKGSQGSLFCLQTATTLTLRKRELLVNTDSNLDGPKEVKLLEPKDEEETRISFQNKRYSFWDKSHPGSVINKVM